MPAPDRILHAGMVGMGMIFDETYRPFFIMGEVRTPGQYTYVDGLTVQTAIAIAGGYTPRAFERYVEISRRINDELITGTVPPSEASACSRAASRVRL